MAGLWEDARKGAEGREPPPPGLAQAAQPTPSLLQEGAPLPGPKRGLLSNTRE